VPSFMVRNRCGTLVPKQISVDLPGRERNGGLMDMQKRVGAEFFGTFWLTFAGCGSAVLAAGFPSLGIGFLGVSFAFGGLCRWPHLWWAF